MSNDNPFSEPGQEPVQATMQPVRTSSNKSIGLLIGCGLLIVSLPVLGICAGLLLPAIQAAREASRRMSCANNLKEIGLALHNYQSIYGSLPPAYTVDDQGRPLHSWRTLILPQLNQEALYSQIDLTKPWDDPANAAVAQAVVPTYACPSTVVDPQLTTYVAVVDPGGLMSGPTASSLDDVPDGMFATLLVAETDSGNAVPWMSPQDIDLATFLETGTRRDAGGHFGGAHILTADGAVQFVTDTMAAEIREALVLKEDGVEVDYE